MMKTCARSYRVPYCSTCMRFMLRKSAPGMVQSTPGWLIMWEVMARAPLDGFFLRTTVERPVLEV